MAFIARCPRRYASLNGQSAFEAPDAELAMYLRRFWAGYKVSFSNVELVLGESFVEIP